MKVKSDYRSKFSNLSNWKEECLKKSGPQRDSKPLLAEVTGLSPVEALTFSGFYFPIA